MTRLRAAVAQAQFPLLVPAFFVLLLVWAFFALFPQYLPLTQLLQVNFEQSELQENPPPAQFPFIPHHNARGYRLDPHGGTSGSGAIRLVAKNGINAVYSWYLVAPQRYQYLLVRAKLRTKDILPGKNKWDGGRLDLLFYSAEGKINWAIRHEVIKLTGSNDWKTYQCNFVVPKETRLARISLSQTGAGGTLWADTVECVAMRPNPDFIFWKKIAGGLLLTTFLAYLIVLARGQIRTPLVYLIAAAICLGTMLPQAVISDIVGDSALLLRPIGNYTRAVSQALSAPNNTNLTRPTRKTRKDDKKSQRETVSLVKKTGHLSLFTLLAFIVCRWTRNEEQNRRKSLPTALGCLILFACFTELLQHFSATRTPQLHDLGLDFAGIAAGWLAALLTK